MGAESRWIVSVLNSEPAEAVAVSRDKMANFIMIEQAMAA